MALMTNFCYPSIDKNKIKKETRNIFFTSSESDANFHSCRTTWQICGGSPSEGQPFERVESHLAPFKLDVESANEEKYYVVNYG